MDDPAQEEWLPDGGGIYRDFCEEKFVFEFRLGVEKQLAWRKLCPRQKHKLRLTLQAKNSSRRRDVDLLRAGIGPAQLNSSLSYTFSFSGGYCLAWKQRPVLYL